jgi:steroid 5-alpha reductase family enzyme
MAVQVGTILITTALGALLAQLLLWLTSLRRRDASIVDIYWGLGFAQIAIITAALAGGYPWRKLLLTVLTVLWGARLGFYLFWRNAGRGEDYRYQAMRRHYGTRFPLVSLLTVFGLQGALMWIVSLPVQLGQIAVAPAHLTGLDAAGAALWALGLTFEAVGDWQLARFKADPAHAGAVMDRGLWRYTRHPNYFGDACVWWGLWLIAAAAGAWWTVVSPALMTLLLLKVSGVAMLERTIGKRRPGYAEYVARTSAFVPWLPKSR